MIIQNVNIVNFNLLYDILDEVKVNLSFNIIKYENIKEFIRYEKKDLKNSLIITNTNNENINENNLLILNGPPISLLNLIELINISLIKIRFNSQSKINIKTYQLNLNSKFFSKGEKKLKLTEKEIEIILYLNKNKNKNSVLELQKNIWDYSAELETHTVETHIHRLRKKINDKFDDKNFIMSNKEGYFIN
jgi:hypothetical protein